MKRPAHSKTVASSLVSKHPNLAARTLARMLHKEHNALFPTIERARSMVRYCLGLKGRQQRSNATHPRTARKAGEVWGFIPDGDKEIDWKAHRISAKKVLVLSDIHAPFHDPQALKAALEIGRTEGCDHLFLNGDFWDFYAASRWETDPRRRDFKRELEVGKQILKGMSDHFHGNVTLKMGNHDERYELKMMRDAPLFLDVPDFQFERVTGATEYGITVVKDMRIVQLGKLSAIHGHEYRFAISNPVNPARGLFMRAKTHTICGHFHQTSNHSEADLHSKVISCWSTGCLCDLHPRYMPINKWNHGAAIVHIEPNGTFETENFRIIDGRVYA
jgi:predicted phosphodiesterase